MPKISPAAAARDALDTFDANQNGVLEPDEIKDAPELTSAFRALDSNGDEAVSAVELEQRLRMWINSRQALHILPCQITYRGQPLEGATVRFIPAEFLGEAFKPAEAVTDHYGVANMVHAPEDRPDPDFAQGIRVGFYRVEVSKLVNDKDIIPKKYNVNSILGQEVSHAATGMMQGMVEFHLK